MYCKKELINKYFENKIGFFCSEEHYLKYLDSLSNEEYISLQNRFCVCSDE
ncbi:hypothetical protein [Clostridium sp.]|uniref:hypothetical protein n=1 Tax=Clostridium sp. TaxID=1506 RepID=UPI0025C6FA35|nr:hypothetical protein [Clostridium sp.]